MSNQLPPLATPAEIAEYLRSTTAALAQDRYKGTGPKFIKRGSSVLYRWSDVLEWLDRNTIQHRRFNDVYRGQVDRRPPPGRFCYAVRPGVGAALCAE